MFLPRFCLNLPLIWFFKGYNMFPGNSYSIHVKKSSDQDFLKSSYPELFWNNKVFVNSKKPAYLKIMSIFLVILVY